MNGTKVARYIEAITQANSIEELLPLRFDKGVTSKEGQEKYLNRLKCLTISEAIKSTYIGDKCFSIGRLGVPGVDGLVEMKKILLELGLIEAGIPEFEPLSEQSQRTLIDSINSCLKEILERQV